MDRKIIKVKTVRAEGRTVVYEHGSGEIAFKEIKAKPPDVIIIYFSRLPSHGSRIAEVLKQTKVTRDLPIIFLDGEPEKVAKVKAKVPDGIFITAAELKDALKKFANWRYSAPNGKRVFDFSAAGCYLEIS